MPAQVIHDVGAATFGLRLRRQVLLDVGMAAQVRVDGLTHGLAAPGIGVRDWQRDHRRSGSS
jgi:hypothetical protein